MSGPESSYSPTGDLPRPVVDSGEFTFAVTHLDHGHIYLQTEGLLEAGARLKWVLDTQPERLENFLARYAHTGVQAASSLEQILDDPEVQLVTAAAVPADRGPLGCRVMKAGKDYFTDKCPFTNLAQLEEARAVVEQTKRKYIVYYSERLHVESAVHVDALIREGVIGDIVHLNIMGPHRHGGGRPAWFYQKARYGGILTDICSHQVDQFLHYTGARDGEVLHARVENFANPQYPEFEDFGEAVFRLDTGASCHSRVDWFTPNGLGTWGDGRMFAVGTRGYLEIRKYIDVARENTGDHIYLVNETGEHRIACAGRVGFPFFGQLILDCLNRTERAMTQHHAFKAAELSLKAQALADARRGEDNAPPEHP